MSEHKVQINKILLAILIGLAFFALSLSVFNLTQSALIGSIAFLVTLWTNEGLP